MTCKIKLSEKFNTELSKFFIWANIEYQIFDFDNKEQIWSIDLINGFEEPSRNKLEGVVKAVIEYYCIKQDNNTIGDAKLLVKEFKHASCAIKKRKNNIKLDMSLDTSETYYLHTFDYWTEEFITVFGSPKKVGKKGDECMYEWILKVNDQTYSIHDWRHNYDFDNITWYLSGLVDDKKNIKIITDYIYEILTEKLTQ